MSWLERRPSGVYHIAFRYGGEKFKKSLKTNDPTEAQARRYRLDENIRLVDSGRLVIPDDADVSAFLLSDGRVSGKPAATRPVRTLQQLCQGFFAAMTTGSLEDTTVAIIRIHGRHLKRIIGSSFLVRGTQLVDLQRYIDTRSKEPGRRGRPVSPTTIKKELATFRSMWNWAQNAGHINRPFPHKGLRYPKTAEKPVFQTSAEIERKIARAGLTAAQQADLWDCLFLTLPEIDGLLTHVEKAARHPFIYPMFVFAAHTGVRRSEILRSRVEDIDLQQAMVTVREKKRVRGKLTTRFVPLSPLLKRVLTQWLSVHPGGQYTFCLTADLRRVNTHPGQVLPLTAKDAYNCFRLTVANTQWRNLRGWHVFRHSFCSNCAARGIDQRIINAWVGHQTEEMVRRYRHLIPNQQQEAIRTVFAK